MGRETLYLVFPARRIRASLAILALLTSGCGGGGNPSSEAPVARPPEVRSPVVVEPWLDDRPPPLSEESVGYARRPCGFDIDGDGVRGGPGDCRVCDGRTTDVDGNGLPDRMVYVDCDRSGHGQGTPESPDSTLAAALARLTDRADETIQGVCFTGRCRETVMPLSSGAVGVADLEGFERARFPILVAGWDADADGDYPPWDEDDVAVLDGGGELARAFDNVHAASRIELAHFSVEGYGQACRESESALRVVPPAGVMSHLSVHDLEIVHGGGCEEGAPQAVFELFGDGGSSSFVALSNLWIESRAGFAVSGNEATALVLGPYRMDHLDVESAFAPSISLEGTVNGVEVRQNRFEVRALPASPDALAPSAAIDAGPCTRGWWVRGNTIAHGDAGIVVRPDAGLHACRERDMDGIRIEENEIEGRTAGARAIVVSKGDVTTVRGVDLVANRLVVPGGAACIESNVGVEGRAQDGLVRVLGNACHGPIEGRAGLTIGAPDAHGGEAGSPQERYEVRGNRFVDIETVNVGIGYAPARLILEGNVYDPAAGFSWRHDDPGVVTHATLADWAAASGEAPNSVSCRPEVLGCTPLFPPG